MELNDPVEPAAPAEDNPVAFQRWKCDYLDHRTKLQEYANFRAGLYNVVFGQCSEALQDKLRSHTDFPGAYQDGIALLIIIKTLTYSFEERRKLADALSEIKESFYTFKQGKHMSLQRYYELFLNQVEVMEEVGITIADDSLINSIAAANQHEEPDEEDRVAAQEQALAVRFLRGTNSHHASYLTHLRNSFLDGYDNYPSTLHDAYNVLQRREPDHTASVIENDGVAFLNNGQQAGNRRQVTCFNCGEVGHYANQCEKPNQQGNVNCNSNPVNMNGNGFTFSQPSHSSIISKTWILLDNQSTIDLFCNADLLSNIRTSRSRMNVKCNAGVRSTNLVGDLANYGTVWYDPHAIANILSLKRVSRKYDVQYVSGKTPKFMVTKPNGEVFEFIESEDGLHYMESKKSGTVMINTVADNRSNYTNQDYLNAIKARELQIKIGRPSTADFIRIVNSNTLKNCPVTKADVMAAEQIFGPDVGSLKGKTVRRRPHVVKQVIEMLPADVMSRYRRVTLCVDVMFVNEIPMLVTLSRNIHFTTVEAIANRSTANLMKAIKNVVSIYKRAGFQIEAAMMDGEFTKLRGELADIGIALNEAARDEHVGEIERFIRTLKERMRSIYNTLPFTNVPPRLVIEMAKYSIYWLNAFPNDRGVSDTLSPRTIITGQIVDYNRHCKYQFGQYVQTHEHHDNTMIPRTIGALALRPTGNAQGNFYFLSLSTGRVINRAHATALPMPDDVIDRVNRMARQQKANPGLLFADRRNVVMNNNENDVDSDDEQYEHDEYDSDDDNSDNDNDINTEGNEPDDDDAAYDDDDVIPYNEEVDNGGNQNNEPIAGVAEDPIAEIAGVAAENNDEAPVAAEAEIAGVAAENNDEVLGANEVPVIDEQVEIDGNDNEADDMDHRYGPRSGRYELRPRKPRDYSHLFVEVDAPLATPQMNMHQGLRLFGEAGVEAVRSEMQQLHDRKVMAVRKASELTIQQKQEALNYLMFLKRKRCGKIKGRGCADGRKQRLYIPKADAASPTVANEAVFLTAVVDAKEGREVAILDVPGAFMQADMDELVHVRFTGKMVDLLVEIDPEMFGPCVCYENGTKVIYVELLKALYGTLRAARLFWEKLSQKLESWDFKKNPYDPCVANKMVNGKQLTVAWHVDDLKVSHVDKSVVDDFIQKMESEFGKETPINKARGCVHDYLGMVMDYSVKGQVSITMFDYIRTILHDAPKEMRGTAVTPAASHLFQISEDPVYLSEDKSKIFVHFVMQLLYLSQRARPDIQTAVSFLCGRLKSPDEDDYKKLCRVMKYLDGTIQLPLILQSDNSEVIKWWVDASFAVHPNMKGHTGGTMSLGSGSIYSTSRKQKLVSRSSTESEVVAVHDVMPQILWTTHFLQAQGIPVKHTMLFQDNMSSILLEKNGRSSSTKRTRHMNIRYFYVKDHVDNRTITIEHCPTNDMVADFFTKPLQGHLFKRLRDRVMNIDPSDKHHSDHRSVLEVNETGTVSDDNCLDGSIHASANDALIQDGKDRFKDEKTNGVGKSHSWSFTKD
jgi:hypothetical protein